MVYYWIFRSEKFREAMKSLMLALLITIPLGIVVVYVSEKISEIYGYDKVLVFKITVTIVMTILFVIGVAICLWCDRKLKEEKEISIRQIAILEKYSKLITEDNFMEMIEKQDKEIEAMRKEVRASRL